jgi:CMP-N,N'-diacetyllegionaminic acid synthase
MKKNVNIALIPARGGSKRLPGKNIKLLADKPMIAYAIEAARNSGCFLDVIVTTDDNDIAHVAKEFGANVITRPAELATDTAKTIDVVLHALDILKKEGREPEIITLMQPTSPLCNSEDVKNAVDIFLNNDCDSVVSMYEPSTPPYWMFKEGNPYIQPLFGWDYLAMRSQDLPRTLMPNGAVYVELVAALKSTKKFYGPKTIPSIMPADRSTDIDTELDFIAAQSLLEKSK